MVLAYALVIGTCFSAICVILFSLLAGLDSTLAICTHGHPAMATAGLGDVLAGVIGASALSWRRHNWPPS